MPIVTIKLIDAAVSKQQKDLLIKGATQLLVDVLDKNPESTHVIIEEINTDNWGLGGKSVSERLQKTKQ